VLHCLIADLEDDLQQGSAKWIEAVQGSLYTAWDNCPEKADRNGQHLEWRKKRIQLRDALDTADPYGRPKKQSAPMEQSPSSKPSSKQPLNGLQQSKQ
jgi:hypothetical protein